MTWSIFLHAFRIAASDSGMTKVMDALHALSKPEYSPRRSLYMAHPVLLWTNVLPDLCTVLAYVLFVAGIWWLVRQLKRLPQLRGYVWVFASFQVFLIASVTGIVIRTINIWLPLYQVSTIIKIVCAAASLPTAIVFSFRLPRMAANVFRFFALLTDEKKKGEALRRSEHFLDRTNRIAGVGGWEVDLVDNTVIWSAETCRIHGVPIDYSPTLEGGLAFYTEDCRPVITSAVKRACSGGGGFDLELSITRTDGELIWVRAVGGVEFSNGVAARLTGAFQDISAWVAQRTALKQANERAVLATDSGEIGIWDWDLIKGVVHCDRWMHRLHGIEWVEGPADELRWREQLHPEDRDAVVQALYCAVDGTCPYDTEFRVLWPDGSIHNIRATGKVERDAEGRAVRLVGANWDVTKSRQLTAELAQQHELLRVTLQSIGDGVITTDAQSNVLWLNPVAERMTGWTVPEAVGAPIADVFSIVNADTRVPVENPVATCLMDKQTVRLAPNTILVGRDGIEFGIEDSAAPIMGEAGELLGAVLVFHDATEQRRLLTEANRVAKTELKVKTEFLSHVSHELRSPLTSIYSFTSIIADGLAGATTPQQEEYCAIVLKNVEQLQGMIEDLLTVTQANEGKLRIVMQSVLAADAVVDAMHTVHAAATKKHILITESAEAELLCAHADPLRLRQILIILLDNAVKFTPHGGTIVVRVKKTDENHILFQVCDSGLGIPADKQTRVFENLYQVTGSDQQDTSLNGRNGLGLGLYIAKDLVNRQGGQIWIGSSSEKGSVFCFTLPLFRENAHTETFYRQEPAPLRQLTAIVP